MNVLKPSINYRERLQQNIGRARKRQSKRALEKTNIQLKKERTGTVDKAPTGHRPRARRPWSVCTHCCHPCWWTARSSCRSRYSRWSRGAQSSPHSTKSDPKCRARYHRTQDRTCCCTEWRTSCCSAPAGSEESGRDSPAWTGRSSCQT